MPIDDATLLRIVRALACPTPMNNWTDAETRAWEEVARRTALYRSTLSFWAAAERARVEVVRRVLEGKL